MSVIDFHTHILPGIDDGSRSLESSMEMLKIEASQGVERIVLTPHFYADRDRIETFLKRRQQAYSQLKQAIDASEDASVKAIKLYLGGEVAYFSGIAKANDIDQICIYDPEADGGSGQAATEKQKLMLLEMPFMPWNDRILDEIEMLIEKRGLTLILAHLERYLGFRENKAYIRELMEMPLYIQINAESLTNWRLKGKLVRMFKAEEAHLLGSDSHGTHHRVPNLAQGRNVLLSKGGLAVMERVDRLGSKLLDI